MSSVIEINNLSLSYPIYEDSELSIRKKIVNLFSKNILKSKISTISALKNINLVINKGEKVGLIGPNGSGKTTFLKTIAGIYNPTFGTIKCKFEVYTLLDIGMGLNIDATGIENIEIMCLIRGLSLDEIYNKKNNIIEFSGLKESINYPLRTYSSGMIVRLATSIALESNFDILAIDEFFGAGDEDFRNKTAKKLKQMMEDSKAFLFASHDMNLIKNICNRIIRFENGEIVEDIYL
jgi:lipopolysaccharide transport system ATP-binding protein